MKKLISIVLLLNLCFAIDVVAKEVGFTDVAEGALNPVLIDGKVSIKIDKTNETLRCQSLHTQIGSELEFTKSTELKTADLTIEASEDLTINGKLTLEKGISLTLISKSFLAQKADIKAPKLFVQAENISIVSSEILSHKVTLGTESNTRTLLFDKNSKISLTEPPFDSRLPPRFNVKPCIFNAQEICAHGIIDGKAMGNNFIEFNVISFINIDDLTLSFRDLGSIIINLGDVDFTLLSTSSQAGAALEGSSSSLLSNIERLLKEIYKVEIKSKKKIAVNSTVSGIKEVSAFRFYPRSELKSEVKSSIDCPPLEQLKSILDYHGELLNRFASEKRGSLTLNAPIIEINADIKVSSLTLCGQGVSSEVSISAGTNLLVDKLKLSGTCIKDTIMLPDTTKLEMKNSSITISNVGKLARVANNNSSILCLEIPHGFMLDEYKFSGVLTDDKLHSYAKKIVIFGVTMTAEEHFALPASVEFLEVEKSKITIKNVDNLRAVQNENSKIICLEIPDGFKLDRYICKLYPPLCAYNFDEIISEPLMYMAKTLIFECSFSSLKTIDFPEFKKPLMEYLEFKNCKINFKKILAKGISFEGCKVTGNYIALLDLQIKDSEVTLNEDNIFTETNVKFLDTKISLTSKITLPKFIAQHCSFDLKDFTMRAKVHSFSMDAARHIKFKAPFVDCNFTKNRGRLELFHVLV